MSMSAARRHRGASRRHRARVRAGVYEWIRMGMPRREARVLERIARMALDPPVVLNPTNADMLGVPF